MWILYRLCAFKSQTHACMFERAAQRRAASQAHTQTSAKTQCCSYEWAYSKKKTEKRKRKTMRCRAMTNDFLLFWFCIFVIVALVVLSPLLLLRQMAQCASLEVLALCKIRRSVGYTSRMCCIFFYIHTYRIRFSCCFFFVSALCYIRFDNFFPRNLTFLFVALLCVVFFLTIFSLKLFWLCNQIPLTDNKCHPFSCLSLALSLPFQKHWLEFEHEFASWSWVDYVYF